MVLMFDPLEQRMPLFYVPLLPSYACRSLPCLRCCPASCTPSSLSPVPGSRAQHVQGWGGHVQSAVMGGGLGEGVMDALH